MKRHPLFALRWMLCALVLLAAQTLAMVHGFAHVHPQQLGVGQGVVTLACVEQGDHGTPSPTPAAAHDGVCGLCIVAASLGAAPTASALTLTPVASATFQFTRHDTSRPASAPQLAFHSRAPPLHF